jgi:hypothetical protein
VIEPPWNPSPGYRCSILLTFEELMSKAGAFHNLAEFSLKRVDLIVRIERHDLWVSTGPEVSCFDQRRSMRRCSLAHRLETPTCLHRRPRANRSWLIKDGHLSSSKPLLCFASNKIDSHPCAKCRAPMVLTRIKTARLAFDVCTFECFNCDNVDKIMTETKRGSTYDPTPL